MAKTTLPDKCIFQCKNYKRKKKQELKHSRYKYLVNGNNAPLSDSRPALVVFFLFTNNLRHINLNLRDLNKLHYFAHTRFVWHYIYYMYSSSLAVSTQVSLSLWPYVIIILECHLKRVFLFLCLLSV